MRVERECRCEHPQENNNWNYWNRSLNRCLVMVFMRALVKKDKASLDKTRTRKRPTINGLKYCEQRGENVSGQAKRAAKFLAELDSADG